MSESNLSTKQQEAINTIDQDVEIIACAGAGKTGVVTRRIVNILKSKPDVKPDNIVAFTFTHKAAEELRSRIYDIARREIGSTQGFANMYIGTIHGFCLKMLQEYLPEFGNFTVLDEVHTKLFVDRYYYDIGMTNLGLQMFIDTDLFIKAMSLLNENWYDSDRWDESTRTALERYQAKLYAEKHFDYSLILREMVQQLESNLVFRMQIADKVKYLTVDEYQDTNPIQEKLIAELKALGANLCVVGDDDQTIYQFRGSDSTNILTFVQRYNIQKYIVLDTDYRSTKGIVDVARHVIVQNSRRLPKEMQSGCKTEYDEGDIVYKEFDYSEYEYEFIAQKIEKLHNIGIPYSEIAILLRKRKIGADIAEVLEEHGIPFIIEGVNDLMRTPECRAAKGIFEYLHDDIDLNELYDRWIAIDYPLNERELSRSIDMVMTIDVARYKHYPDFNLQTIFHDFLKNLTITDDGRPQTEIILYNLGKFSQVINDYSSINYTLNPKPKLTGFCNFLKYTAEDYYPEGNLTNNYTKPDAVPIMTIHQSKGLEFAAVFIPNLNKNYFPARKIGGKSVWHIIDRSWITGSGRFDGDLEDERKLFYVAVTRAKKYLFLTRPKDGTDKNISPFMVEAMDSPCMLAYDENRTYNAEHLPDLRNENAPITFNFSLLEDYFDCPFRFKLAVFYGFSQPINEQMGYGNALHAVVERINRAAMDGVKITKEFVEKAFDESFWLPYASPKMKERMTASAKRSIEKYVEHSKNTFSDIVYAESDIEMDLGDGIGVNGRIDMVKLIEIDGKPQTVIVDFKTANKRVLEQLSKEQLKIYALGYKHLTGELADCMEIYHLDSENYARLPVTKETLTGVEEEIRSAADKIRRNDLPRKCSKENCSKCHLSHLCLGRKEQRELLGG